MTAKCGHGFDEWPLALVPETELFMFWNSVLVYNINMCLVDFILYKEGGYHGWTSKAGSWVAFGGHKASKRGGQEGKYVETILVLFVLSSFLHNKMKKIK